MVILKELPDYDQPPLLILRRGYSQNVSNLHHSATHPNWWQTQLISRSFQLPQGQKFDLVHQRMHVDHHYLFFNRGQLFRNPMDDFLPITWQKHEVSFKFYKPFIHVSTIEFQNDFEELCDLPYCLSIVLKA